MMKFVKTFLVTVALGVFSMGVSAQAATVVIDPGHGGAGLEGVGAVYAPYVEKALTMDVATKLCDELNASGISTSMTRTTDTALSLADRAAKAKSEGAKLLVSIHFNASGPHDKSGTEVWTSMAGNHYKVGSECGNQILANISALGLSNKGVKVRGGSRGDYYGVIRYGVAQGIPTIIVEHCFIDNAYDRAILESKGTAAFAHADAVGISTFLGSATGQALVNGTLDVSPATAVAGVPAATSVASSSLKANFSATDWQWLLSHWAYTGNAEAIISQVPLGDLQSLVSEHNKGNI